MQDGQRLIVALHGIQGTHSSWEPVAQRLADLGRWVLPDLRGRGSARRGAGPADYGLAQYASDAADAIERETAGRPFLLAGWSLGVSVALELLGSRPELKPAGLILLSGSPCLARLSWFEGDGDALLGAVAAREQRLGLRAAADHDAVAWTWQAIRHSDQRALLGRIQTPALVLHGEQDEDCPIEHARWLAEGLPRAALKTLPGAGHGLLGLHADWVAQAIRDGLDEQERTA